MTSLTAAHITANLALAGPGYAWEGVKGTSDLPSYARPGLRIVLAERQEGICPQCGDALEGTLNFCHIVPRGPLKKGWTASNVFLGHAACNGFVLGESDHAMTFADLARPDLIDVTPWPGVTELGKIGGRR
jgi:hypothetical protein